MINNTAVDLLRRLPGVGEGNYRSLMTAADSLAGLAAMTLKVGTLVICAFTRLCWSNKQLGRP